MSKKNLAGIVYIACLIIVSIKGISYTDDGENDLIFTYSTTWIWHEFIIAIFVVIGIQRVSFWVAEKFGK